MDLCAGVQFKNPGKQRRGYARLIPRFLPAVGPDSGVHCSTTETDFTSLGTYDIEGNAVLSSGRILSEDFFQIKIVNSLTSQAS